MSVGRGAAISWDFRQTKNKRPPGGERRARSVAAGVVGKGVPRPRCFRVLASVDVVAAVGGPRRSRALLWQLSHSASNDSVQRTQSQAPGPISGRTGVLTEPARTLHGPGFEQNMTSTISSRQSCKSLFQRPGLAQYPQTCSCRNFLLLTDPVFRVKPRVSHNEPDSYEPR